MLSVKQFYQCVSCLPFKEQAVALGQTRPETPWAHAAVCVYLDQTGGVRDPLSFQ